MKKIISKFRVFLLFWVLAAPVLNAQEAVRLSADFTIKQKIEGKGQLVKGKVYFDKKIQKICYEVAYPEPAFWVVKDTVFYEFNADTQFVKSTVAPYSPAFSIYQTILDNNFDDLGLKTMGFTIGTVEKADTAVITEWLPSERLKKSLGKILLSHVSRKLSGVVYFDPKGVVLSKEQYKNFSLTEDKWVPGEVVAMTYKDQKLYSIKITNLRNVRFNETTHTAFYDFPLPPLVQR